MPSYNTAYTLQVNALALRDIAPFGHNVVYAGNVRQNGHLCLFRRLPSKGEPMEKSIVIIGAGIPSLSAGGYGQMNGYRTQIIHDMATECWIEKPIRVSKQTST